MTFEIQDTGPDIPPGTYKGQLAGSEIREGGDFGGKFRVWDFLVELEGVMVPISATSSLNTGPKSKAYQWLTALLGRAPVAGEKLENPTGKTVLITVSRKENGFPKVDMLTAYAEPAQTEAGIPR